MTGVELTAHPFLTMSPRPDEPSGMLSHEEAMRNAPSQAGGLFMVPKVWVGLTVGAQAEPHGCGLFGGWPGPGQIPYQEGFYGFLPRGGPAAVRLAG